MVINITGNSGGDFSVCCFSPTEHFPGEQIADICTWKDDRFRQVQVHDYDGLTEYGHVDQHR